MDVAVSGCRVGENWSKRSKVRAPPNSGIKRKKLVFLQKKRERWTKEKQNSGPIRRWHCCSYFVSFPWNFSYLSCLSWDICKVELKYYMSLNTWSSQYDVSSWKCHYLPSCVTHRQTNAISWLIQQLLSIVTQGLSLTRNQCCTAVILSGGLNILNFW